MIYVLKYVGLGPDDFLEHCYDEVISIKGRIALVQFEHNMNKLLGMGFEYVGQIENEGDLKKLFDAKDTTVAVRKEKAKVVPLGDILHDEEGVQKSWYENLA